MAASRCLKTERALSNASKQASNGNNPAELCAAKTAPRSSPRTRNLPTTHATRSAVFARQGPRQQRTYVCARVCVK